MMHASSKPGAMLLLVVLIVGAAALSVSLMIALRAIGELDSGIGHTQSIQAQFLADACAEEALLRIGRNPSFQTGSIVYGNNTCSIETTQSGSYVHIDISAQVERSIYTLSVLFDAANSSIEEYLHVR